MNTVPHIKRYAEQWWDWEEIRDYLVRIVYINAKYKDMEWSEQQCKDFLEEHEEEISMALREVGDDLIDNWLYDIKSDLDDAEDHIQRKYDDNE